MKFAKFLRTPFFTEHSSEKRNAANKVKKDKKWSFVNLGIGTSTLELKLEMELELEMILRTS